MPILVRSFEYVVRRLKSTNYQLSATCYRNGFTLIEFLVVLALLSLTIGSALLFLTNLIKGANQANIVAETKQNGQVVLDSLEKMVRNAVSAEQLTACASGPDPNCLRLDVGSNKYLYIKGCIPSFDNNEWIGVVEKDVSLPIPGDSEFKSVTNQDPVSGVDIENCEFEVIGSSDGDVSPAIVNLKFVAHQGSQAPSRRDFQANVEFKTTISLRKYN